MVARDSSLNALISKITQVVDPNGGIRSTRLLAGATPNHTVADAVQLEEKTIKICIAQALLDNIAPAPDGLVVRDILIDEDFEDLNDNAISRRDAVQPTSGTWASGDINSDTIVYITNNDVDNQKKVMGIYGLRAVNTGPGDSSTTIGVASVTFQRGSQTRIVDIWPVEEIDTTPTRTLYARTPILFKAGDNQRVAFQPVPKGSGNSDNLMVLAKIVERTGDVLTG